MIERYKNKFILYCDVCGEEAEEEFYEFDEAVEYKKDNGWRSRKIKGEWADICPECLGED